MMNASLKDQMKAWNQKNGQQEKAPKKKPEKQRKTETLSEQDIMNLMGMNRPRYSRGKGGALRQK